MTYPEDKLSVIAELPHGEQERRFSGHQYGGAVHFGGQKGRPERGLLHAPDADMFRRLQKKRRTGCSSCATSRRLPGAIGNHRGAGGRGAPVHRPHRGGYDTACEAFRRGARQVTHLYNAMPPLSHRAHGVIGAAAITTRSRSTDRGRGAYPIRPWCRADYSNVLEPRYADFGQHDGHRPGGRRVTRSAGRRSPCTATARRCITVPIAGSATDLLDCVRSAVKMGIPLGQAIRSASTNPARAIGVQHDYGSLEPGQASECFAAGRRVERPHAIARPADLTKQPYQPPCRSRRTLQVRPVCRRGRGCAIMGEKGAEICHPIDLQGWERRIPYAFHAGGLRLQPDAGALRHRVCRRYTKESGLRFFSAFTWAVAAAVNSRPEFRLGYDSAGRLGRLTHASGIHRAVRGDGADGQPVYGIYAPIS